MAMHKYHIIKETHTKQITALAYNPLKHEIVVGCDDGAIKTWDCLGDNVGKLTKVCREHSGWINCFLYWSDMKLLLSAANDGKLVAWGSSMLPASVTKLSAPIYSMAWNVRRNQIILGMNASLRVYTLVDPTKDGKILSPKAFVATDHTDIVKALICFETRVYSVGFDRRFCIYDSYSYPGKKGLKLVTCLYPAHDAGITTLKMARDNENNTWLLTGAFDKTVKIWSQDGQMMHKFDGFSCGVTSIAYVIPTKTVWIAAGSADIPMFDPKSVLLYGSSQVPRQKQEYRYKSKHLTAKTQISHLQVSEFIGTFHCKTDCETHPLCLLQFVPETNQLIATDNRRRIIMWKYNPAGCITALKHKHAVECLTYTRKIPMLIFSGDNAGQITKWERLQSNHFMYSNETLPRSEAVAQLASQIAQKYDWAVTDKTKIREQLLNTTNNNISGTSSSQNIAAMQLLFVEDLDLLLVASEDNNIYVWGFDYEAVSVLMQMQPKDDVISEKFQCLLRNDFHNKKEEQVESNTNTSKSNTSKSSNLGKRVEGEEENEEDKAKKLLDDSVTNRVAGFICKSVFSQHKHCVSGLAVVDRSAGYETTFLISVSWDRRIIIWDLERMSYHDVFRNTDKTTGFESEELASDGIITDLVYCAERNEFGYSSSDRLVYIREFSPNGSAMKLKAVLQGHAAEVTKICWNAVHKKWITGSEDSTIRVWSSDGVSCDLVLSVPGTVTALCVDNDIGCVVAGIQDVIRVYDIEAKRLVQANVGHTEAIRYLIHIPERQQYVSASWDKTVRVWNAYTKCSAKRNSTTMDFKTSDTENEENEDGDV